MSKLADHLDRLRLIPRLLALGMFSVAAYCVVYLTHKMAEDGIDGAAELTAITAVLISLISGSTALVNILGKSENGHHKKD